MEYINAETLMRFNKKLETMDKKPYKLLSKSKLNQTLKEKKAKPILQPESESDLAWGIKFFAEGIQGLTKKMEKPTSQAQYEHNQQLIEKMKAEIKAKESIKAQYEEYKALYDRLKALQAEQKVCEPVKKKGIFK